ncbi:protein MODIFIER OF SNC1 1-like [Phragmites australis]|uniref:protein MODIFIER OF SNC1 1-like n=1 Tax=Phragmites australis TaxID=29695 RepID=UPI002D76E7D2|nr:protein MODIFIER OF SNC1 1-like [Phragmites australis]
MASSLLTTDRRWAAPPARKSGMTVLGRVPKPINLPSQRLENNGLDPNLEIVPKGTLTWGSKLTPTAPNAWGSSSILSIKIDGSSSSSSHLNGRPSSGGGSRPSTAGSESLGSPNAWGPNSRPSSASGTLPSPHLPIATNRPRSAETRPGSSQLSRFADNASENVKASMRTIDRLGSSSHGHGFTLSTGDFPTLGSEKCSELNSQRGHSSKGRPTSSSGKEASQNEQGKSLTAGSVEVISPPNNQPADIMKTEQHVHTGGASLSATSLPNVGQQPQPYPPNFRMPPPQFDSWRPSPGHPPEGMWHRGPASGGPYRPVGPPGSFPVEPFGYYGQFPPNSEAAARQGSGHGGYHPKNGDAYHPMPPNSYIMNQPVIPVRPVYQGPVPYDGYYGPRANFNNANVGDPHFVGGPHQPGILNQFPNLNDKFHPGHSQNRPGKHESVPREQLESDKVHVFRRGQPRILHDNPDRIGGTHEVERNTQPAPPLLPHPDGNWTDVNMRTGIRDTFSERNRVLTKSVTDQRSPAATDHLSVLGNAHPRETGDGTLRKKFKEDNLVTLDQQPVIKKNAALIEKIESLNNKARNVDARNVPESASSKEFKEKHQKSIDSKADQVMKDVSSTAVIAGIASASDQKASVSQISPVLQGQPNVPTYGPVVGPSHSQLTELSKGGKIGDSIDACVHRRGDSSRNSHHGSSKDRSDNKFAGHGRGESYATDSLPVVDLRNSQHEQPPESASQLPPVTVTDDMPATPDYESQRAKMRELAAQRAKKLQAEEEERIKNQKAKALAKLEELNRRSSVLQKNPNDTTEETDDVHNEQKAGLDVTAKLANSTAELRDVTASDSLTALQPRDPKHIVPAQPQSATLSHTADVGKDPAAHATSSSARNAQSNMEHVAQKSISQSHSISVPKPKQGYRKRHVVSEEKIPDEKPIVPVSPANARKHVDASFDTAVAVVTPHGDPPAQNKKGARHSRNKKKVDDAPVTLKYAPVVFNEQNAVKVSSEPKTQTGGVIISSSIVPTEGTIVTVGSITVGGISLAPLNQERVKSPDGTQNSENSRSRPQQARKSGKHQPAVRPVENPHGNEGIVWAPVNPSGHEQSDGALLNTAVAEPAQPAEKNSNDGENVTRTKRAEMERYVPKPLSKELQQQNLGQNLQSDNKSHGKEAVEKSSNAKFDAATEPKKSEDKKTSKGHGKSHPSWRRRNTEESAVVVPNPVELAYSSRESKAVQKSSDQNKTLKPDKQEDKLFNSKVAASAENSSAPAQAIPLPVSAAKEHSATNRQRRQHVKAQRNEASSYSNESKDREGRNDFVYQSATPAMDSNSSDHRNMPRSDVKNSGVVSHSKAHWKPKSNFRSHSSSQGNSDVEVQMDSHGGRFETNSSEGFDSTTRQGSSDEATKRSGGIDEKDAFKEQENVQQEDGNQKSESHVSAEQQHVNPPLRHQGHHNGRYNRGGGTHRGRGYDAGRTSHGTNAERRRGGTHLEYQPVGSYNKPSGFQQNPSVDERTEVPPASGLEFRERGHNRGPRHGHFVKRNPTSEPNTNSYQDE